MMPSLKLVAAVVLCIGAASATAGQPLPVEPTKLFVIDTKGDGFRFTSAADGVMFDADGNGRAVRTGWTTAASDDGFLVLDVDGNGRIDSGRDMLGSAFRDSVGRRVTGNVALRLIQGLRAEPEPSRKASPLRSSGTRVVETSDGRRVEIPTIAMPTGEDASFLSADDEVFARLRVWTDTNHDGKSEAHELKTLRSLGIQLISAGFRKPSPPIEDAHGNRTYLLGVVSTGGNRTDERAMNYVEFSRK